MERNTFRGLYEQIAFKIATSPWELFRKVLRETRAQEPGGWVFVYTGRREVQVSALMGRHMLLDFFVSGRRLVPSGCHITKSEISERSNRWMVTHFLAGFETLRNRTSVEQSAYEAPQDHSRRTLTVDRCFAAFVAYCITRHVRFEEAIPRH